MIYVPSNLIPAQYMRLSGGRRGARSYGIRASWSGNKRLKWSKSSRHYLSHCNGRERARSSRDGSKSGISAAEKISVIRGF